MRTVGLAIGVLFVAAAVSADDIYTWTDAAGNVHYSNTSGAEGATRRRGDAETRPAEPAAKTPARDGGSNPEAGVADTYSADVSLRRNALERELRATERKIRDLDGRLATFERARRIQANDTVATGGVRTNVEIRSEEEKALIAEREQLAQHTAEVKNEAATLRQEVTAHAGGTTPAWWIDVH